MTLFDLITYAAAGIYITHDGDDHTKDSMATELKNFRILWKDELFRDLDDLTISLAPFSDGSEPEDFDGESHFINEDDGFNPYMGQYDWDS